MRRLHYFNPENDLALAAGIANYTAPEPAMRLHRAGAALPLWYAQPGDRVLCYGVNVDWLDRVQADFGIKADVYNHSDILAPDPWGWSLAAKRAFLREGLPEEMLPSDADLQAMRSLSHRAQASGVARRVAELCQGIEFACGPAIEAKDQSCAENILLTAEPLVLKAPWSCSGRGVLLTAEAGRDKALRFACDTIRKQGCVMVERAIDKSIDFAKIFECKDGKCSVLGTSVFITDSRGAYTGNLLMSEDGRQSRVAQHCSPADLHTITEALRQAIEETYAPRYDGILGVDMLVDRQGRIDPVVEINMRKTMGYVANVFADRYLPAGAHGLYQVRPAAATGCSQNNPAYAAEGGKLISGTLSLIPPAQPFQITAAILD